MAAMTDTVGPAASFPPDIRELADAVRKKPHLVKAAWDRLGTTYHLDDRPPAELTLHAFVLARGLGLTEAFAKELIASDLLVPARKDRILRLLDPLYDLQAFTSNAWLPADPRAVIRGLVGAIELVCRVDVDGQHRGTGVLIAPTMVATAAHVVRPLTETSTDGSLKAQAGSQRLLSLTFGDLRDFLPDGQGVFRTPSTTASIAPDWLAWASPPLADTDTIRDRIDNIEGIDIALGPWDIALIRLAKPVVNMSNPPELEADLPRRPSQINVLHHPSGGTRNGEPMLWSIGVLDRQLGSPPVRLLHNASTLRGSSGAPVFDASWRVIGIHEAGQREVATASEGDAVDAAARNRAIPTKPWACHLAGALAASDNVPYLETVSDVDAAGVPRTRIVIGRRETQRRLWFGAQAGAGPVQRLHIVRGAPGLGLRFTKLIVRGIAQQRAGQVAAIDVANCLGDSGEEFAAKIVGSYLGVLGTRAPGGYTTRERGRRKETGSRLRRKLNELATPAGLWVAIEGFDEVGDAVPTEVTGVVHTLMENLPAMPHVRLVLAGFTGEPPLGYEGAIEVLGKPTEEDIYKATAPAGELDQAAQGTLNLIRLLLAQPGYAGSPPYEAALSIYRELVKTSAQGQDGCP